jgi:hypothetical protein
MNKKIDNKPVKGLLSSELKETTAFGNIIGCS